MLRPVDSSKLVPAECHDLKRLGSRHHGGFVVPLKAVQRTKHLISFGLSQNWAFEEDFRRHNPNVCIHYYDHALSLGTLAAYSLKNFSKLMIRPSKTTWHQAVKFFSYRGFFRGHIHHHQNRVWYNHDNDSVTMRDVFAEAPHGEVFLKIDIEGSEYRILDAVLEFHPRIDAMVIEFHHIDIMAGPFEEAITQIGEHFHVVHVHGNNYGGLSPSGFPNLLEVTFQNRRLFEGDPPRSRRSYPVHGLDARNNPERPDLMLHFTL
jgi:hypothetical protein